MPYSQLNSDKLFTHEEWLISVFNSGGFFDAHAVILVEGVKRRRTSGVDVFAYRDSLFVGQYDIVTISLEDKVDDAIRNSLREAEAKGLSDNIRSLSGKIDGLLKNKFGVISNIRIFEGDDYSRKDGYGKFKGQSVSYLVTPEQAQTMIVKIHAQAQQIKEAWRQRNVDALPRYQYRGCSHPFGNSLGGVNCAEWCYMQLNHAGIDKMSSKPPKPKLCIIG